MGFSEYGVHYGIFSSPALAPTVTPFLDAPIPEDG